MKKLLIALPLLLLPIFASAQMPVVASFGIQAENASTTDVQIFTACSQMAIEIRDGSIGSARTAYNNAMNLALDARKEAEKSAVAILDAGEKKDAIKIAVNEYKKAVTQAQEGLTKARKESWDTFETNTIGCRDMGKNPQAQMQNMKKDATPASASNKAMMQTTITATATLETKTEGKSLGDFLKSIKNFFTR